MARWMSAREQRIAKQRVAVSRNDHILAFGEVFETSLTFWDSMNSFSIRFAILLTLCHTYCCTWPTITKAHLPRLLTVMHTCRLSVQRSWDACGHTLRICTPSYLIHRPEEALDIQSALIFVNGMVHLPHEWNFGTPTALPSPTTPSPLTATPEAIFPLTWRHTFDTTYKIIACIERPTVLRASIMRVTHASIKQVKACLVIHDWCPAPPLRVKLFEKPQNYEL